MSGILHNKVVIVTGASSGIGRATAISAARHGARGDRLGCDRAAPRGRQTDSGRDRGARHPGTVPAPT